MIKVFVDGQKGTTGLEIHTRLGIDISSKANIFSFIHISWFLFNS